MGRKYLINYAIAHAEFRLPELQSISELFGFQVTLPESEEDRDPTRPFMIVELDEDRHAKLLAQRCILVKAIYELLGEGTTYEKLHESTKANKDLWANYRQESFRFEVTAVNHTIPSERKIKIMEEFDYMGFEGPITIANASVVLSYFEEYPVKHTLRKRTEGDGDFSQAFFGRLIEEGACRSLKHKFDVKQRVYYGNTTMDAEISLLMANQALAAPGKLIYDPYCGTGSMLHTSAYFGAMVLGSDIDGRQMRGKNLDPPGIFQSANQYGVLNRILDCCTFDITRNPFRTGGILDAIVSDPPYGVRAGAKRLGRAKERPVPRAPLETYENTTSYVRKPYELGDLTADLVLLARHLLKPGGRLVWFLPSASEEYQDVDIPLCEGMELISNSEQNFGKWGRRLITMRKCTDCPEYPPPSFDPAHRVAELGDQAIAPSGHRGFREKYFAGFKKIGDSSN